MVENPYQKIHDDPTYPATETKFHSEWLAKVFDEGYEAAQAGVNEAYAMIQRLLNAQIFYCECQCPTRDTCTDEKRTNTQRSCALFTKEIPK